VKFENDAGRCTAMLRGNTGVIGFFEAANEPAKVQALLREAAAWLRAQGATQVVGPMDGDTWHRYRVNVGPFDDPPFLLEPVNPPYYADLWSPFEVIERYSSKRVQDVAPLSAKLQPMYERAIARGYTIQPINSQRLQSELKRIFELSVQIFRGNPFYAAISLEEFLKLYEGIERFLVPDLVLFARDELDRDAGFLFAYPDTDENTVNYKTVGVLPSQRRGYLGWAMLHQAYEAARAILRPTANHCLMHESNASQSMDAGHAVTFREYYLYTL